jgi:hypothetical protein
MKQVLTGEEIYEIFKREYCSPESNGGVRYGRAIEQAILAKFGEPVGYYFRDDPAAFAMPGSGFSHEYPEDAVDIVPLYAVREKL